MKKIYIFTALFFFFSTLLPFFNVYADEIIYDNNLITVTPSATSEEITKGNGVGLITELLRQGGSIDFTNSIGTFANFFDSMVESFDSVLTSTFGTSSGLQDIWINPFDFSFNTLTTYINPTEKDPRLQNALKNYRLNLKYFSNSNEEQENPNIDYLYYLDIINGNGFFFKDYNQFQLFGNNNYLAYPLYNYSFTQASFINADYYANNWYDCALSEPLTINIFNSNENEYSFIVTTNYQKAFMWSYPDYYNQGQFKQSGYINNGLPYIGPYDNDLTNRTYQKTGTLEQIFIYLSNNFKNITIYVDGVLWSNPFNTNNYIPIGTDTIVTPYDQNIEYNYNSPVYIIPSDIYDRLEILFNQKLKVTFDDIKDLIVDVNGQTAIAVYEVQVENLDLMYNEKYEGYTNIPYFDKNQVGQMFTLVPYSFVDDGIVVVAAAISPIPTDIIIVFGILFVFVLFACIINRLLE